MKIKLINNKEVNINIFDFKMSNWKGKQENFYDNDITYNFTIITAFLTNSIKLITLGNNYFKIKTSTNDIKKEVDTILNNVKGDVRVAFTNTSVEGRLGNTAVPFYNPFGMWGHINYDTMKIGLHLLNPIENTYDKIITLPPNCNLKSYQFDYFSSSPVVGINTVEQIGDQLHIICNKSANISAKDFSRIVPLYLEFNFDTTGQETVTDFGPSYYVCEIPEIFGAYWRKKA